MGKYTRTSLHIKIIKMILVYINTIKPIYQVTQMSSYIFEHPECDWDYDFLSGNPIISMKDVVNHPEIVWNYNYLS